jgi:hypothetical protein
MGRDQKNDAETKVLAFPTEIMASFPLRKVKPFTLIHELIFFAVRWMAD